MSYDPMAEDLMLGDLADDVITICEHIPPGFVASYGDIAKVVDATPRQVGRIMRLHGNLVCWWRVVRADGSSAIAHRARVHWDDEGIPNDGNRVAISQRRVPQEKLISALPPRPSQSSR